MNTATAAVMDQFNLKLTLEDSPDPERRLRASCDWVLAVRKPNSWLEMYFAKDPMEFQRSCRRALAEDQIRIQHRTEGSYQTVYEGAGREFNLSQHHEYLEILSDLLLS